MLHLLFQHLVAASVRSRLAAVLVLLGWVASSGTAMANEGEQHAGPALAEVDIERPPIPRVHCQTDALSAALLQQTVDPDLALQPIPVEGEDDECDGLVIERSGQVPICLLEGASAVAERPVHEVDGAAAEVAPESCKDLSSDLVSAPHDDDAPPKTPDPAPKANVLHGSLAPVVVTSAALAGRDPNVLHPQQNPSPPLRPPQR